MTAEPQARSTDTNPNTGDVLMEVKGLKKYFPIQKGLLRRTVGYVKAVDDVNFYVRQGETLGLVGESGCGKSTAGRSIIRLYEPTAGQILFRSRALSPNGGGGQMVNLLDLNPDQMKIIRREISMVFQDPINSLNPRMTVSDIVGEPMEIHGLNTGGESEEIIVRLLERVGLRPDHLRRYPTNFQADSASALALLAPFP